MTREFLISLGLEDRILEQILSERQKEREEEQHRVDSMTAELREAQALLSSLKESAEAAEDRHRRFGDQMIGMMIRDARPSSRLAEESARLRLQEAIACGEDPKEVLDALIASDPEAFLPTESCGPIFSTFTEAEDLSSFAKLNTRRW